MYSKASAHQHIEVPGDPAALRKVCEQILSKLKSCRYSKDDVFAIHLGLEESLVNAVKHGNKADATKTVSIDYSVTAEKFDVCIADQGSGFNSHNVPDPRCGDNIYKIGGRGLLLMRSYMDVVEYNEAGNSVHMIKYNKNES